MTEALPLTETSEEDQVAMITRFGFDHPPTIAESMGRIAARAAQIADLAADLLESVEHEGVSADV